MIMSSFQMSSSARPMSTMPATTPATMGMMSGPDGQSNGKGKQRHPMKMVAHIKNKNVIIINRK